MSVESAKEFLKKLAKDEAFKKSIESASDEEKQKIVKEAGFDFTKDEIKEVVGGSSELSDADLEKVAGGSAVTWVSAGASVGGAVAAAF